MKQIYLLSSCDNWKSHSSMSLIMASTSLKKVKAEIIAQIKDGKFEYNRGQENISKNAQIKMFKRDYKEHGTNFVFDMLEYGVVNTVTDGERQ